MKIFIEGRLDRFPGLATRELLRAARYFAERSSARVGQAFQEVTVVLQREAASAAVHQAVMGVAEATDVITQRYEAMPPELPGVYGELYVNVDRARCAAPNRRGWSVAKELLLYVAHGMDHLSGADDCAPAGFTRMRRRELQWMRDYEAL